MGGDLVSEKFFCGFFISLLTLNFSATFVSSESAKLVSDEVHALGKIAKRLGKKDWDFSVDPCSGEGNWSVTQPMKGSESIVSCDCSFNNNSTCHVISMYVPNLRVKIICSDCIGAVRVTGNFLK